MGLGSSTGLSYKGFKELKVQSSSPGKEKTNITINTLTFVVKKKTKEKEEM